MSEPSDRRQPKPKLPYTPQSDPPKKSKPQPQKENAKKRERESNGEADDMPQTPYKGGQVQKDQKTSTPKPSGATPSSKITRVDSLAKLRDMYPLNSGSLFHRSAFLSHSAHGFEDVSDTEFVATCVAAVEIQSSTPFGQELLAVGVNSKCAVVMLFMIDKNDEGFTLILAGNQNALHVAQRAVHLRWTLCEFSRPRVCSMPNGAKVFVCDKFTNVACELSTTSLLSFPGGLPGRPNVLREGCKTDTAREELRLFLKVHEKVSNPVEAPARPSASANPSPSASANPSPPASARNTPSPTSASATPSLASASAASSLDAASTSLPATPTRGTASASPASLDVALLPDSTSFSSPVSVNSTPPPASKDSNTSPPPTKKTPNDKLLSPSHASTDLASPPMLVTWNGRKVDIEEISGEELMSFMEAVSEKLTTRGDMKYSIKTVTVWLPAGAVQFMTNETSMVWRIVSMYYNESTGALYPAEAAFVRKNDGSVFVLARILRQVSTGRFTLYFVGITTSESLSTSPAKATELYLIPWEGSLAEEQECSEALTRWDDEWRQLYTRTEFVSDPKKPTSYLAKHEVGEITTLKKLPPRDVKKKPAPTTSPAIAEDEYIDTDFVVDEAPAVLPPKKKQASSSIPNTSSLPDPQVRDLALQFRDFVGEFRAFQDKVSHSMVPALPVAPAPAIAAPSPAPIPTPAATIAAPAPAAAIAVSAPAIMLPLPPSAAPAHAPGLALAPAPVMVPAEPTFPQASPSPVYSQAPMMPPMQQQMAPAAYQQPLAPHQQQQISAQVVDFMLNQLEQVVGIHSSSSPQARWQRVIQSAFQPLQQQYSAPQAPSAPTYPQPPPPPPPSPYPTYPPPYPGPYYHPPYY